MKKILFFVILFSSCKKEDISSCYRCELYTIEQVPKKDRTEFYCKDDFDKHNFSDTSGNILEARCTKNF